MSPFLLVGSHWLFDRPGEAGGDGGVEAEGRGEGEEDDRQSQGAEPGVERRERALYELVAGLPEERVCA